MKCIHSDKCCRKVSWIIVGKPEIRWFEPINSTKLCWNSDTSTDVWTDTNRRASCSNQASLTAWTSSNASELIPWIEASTPKEIVAIVNHGKLRNVAFGKRNQSSLLECSYDDSIILFHLKSPVGDSDTWGKAFHVESVLDWCGDTEQWVEEIMYFLLWVLESPVFFSWWFSNLVTPFCMGNRIGKINFGNEIELESNSGSSMRVNSSKLFGGDFKIV